MQIHEGMQVESDFIGFIEEKLDRLLVVQDHLGFGLGFETTDLYGANGMDSVGSFGWGGAYGSVYRVDPEAGLSILLMINQLPNSTDIRVKFPTLVYQALE